MTRHSLTYHKHPIHAEMTDRKRTIAGELKPKAEGSNVSSARRSDDTISPTHTFPFLAAASTFLPWTSALKVSCAP